MERICRWPFTIVLERTQNPSITRQHSVGRSPSETIVRPASHGRTIIGSAADGGNVRLIEPVTASSRRNRVATIDSLSKLDSPSPTVSGKTDARGRAFPARLRMRPPRRGKFTPPRRSVKKKRNRSRPVLSLQDHLKQYASLARAKADGLPPGQERDRLIQTAVSNDAAAAIDRWLASPELRSPK